MAREVRSDKHYRSIYPGKSHTLLIDRRSWSGGTRSRHKDLGMRLFEKGKGAHHIRTIPVHQKSSLLGQHDFGNQYCGGLSIMGGAGDISDKFPDHLSGCDPSRKREDGPAFSGTIPRIQQTRAIVLYNPQTKDPSRPTSQLQLGDLQAQQRKSGRLGFRYFLYLLSD